MLTHSERRALLKDSSTLLLLQMRAWGFRDWPQFTQVVSGKRQVEIRVCQILQLSLSPLEDSRVLFIKPSCGLGRRN